MNVDDFLDAVEAEPAKGHALHISIESVRKVFEREFPNGAVDAGSSESFEEEFSAASRQRDRQKFWELVYGNITSAPAIELRNPAKEADYALNEWDKRWGKEGS